MSPFQRARNEEQREIRRQAILDTAAAALTELSVNELGLNELARRVGLAKSNVLRYFESREAVLLELLERSMREWLTALAARLPGPAGPVPARCERLVGELVDSLVQRPVLCDLNSAQAAVLERNVSPQVAVRYKRAAVAATTELAGLVQAQVPELGAQRALQFCAAALMSAGAIWTHAHPSPAMLTVYQQHPELAVLRLDFATALRLMLDVMLAGLLAGDTAGRPWSAAGGA